MSTALSWEPKTLGSFVSIQRGHDLTWRERRKGDVPVIGSAGANGFHDTALVTGPGVVLGRSGASFGQAHYCERDFWPHNTALYVTDFHGNDPLFAFYLLSSIDFSRHNSGGAQQSLNRNFIAPIVISVPSPMEQRAIALALKDVEDLLAGLDRLIAKKRDLKQAAMQQLLTGQSRLPGFESEWAEVRLRDLGTVYGGLTGKTKADFGSGTDRYVTFLNVMSNVTIDHGLFEQVRVGPMESQNLVKSGDLLFNGSSETPEEVAMCSLVSGEIQGRLFLNSFCFGFRLHSGAETDALFLTYYLRSREGRELMKSLAQGSTRYNLSKGALLDSVLHLPSKAEQAAIAVVLGEMDAELLALEARLRKTRSLKQAMMQELLTGRIRLI